MPFSNRSNVLLEQHQPALANPSTRCVRMDISLDTAPHRIIQHLFNPSRFCGLVLFRVERFIFTDTICTKKYKSEIVLVVDFQINIPREHIILCLRKMSSGISEKATVIKVKLKRTFETIYSFIAIFYDRSIRFVSHKQSLALKF